LNVYWTSGRLLLREVVFEAEMVNTAPLRVGVGRTAPLKAPVDLAVIRIRRNGNAEEPYVPGSSLKGVFRTNAELLLRFKRPRVAPCSGLSKNTCMNVKTIGDKKLMDAVQDLQQEGKSEDAMKLFFENACLLCKVFGAPSYAGRVVFQDAYVKGPFRLGFRTGIAIDRRTGAVFERQLYQVEYVEPGARFGLVVSARNLPNYAIGLLARVLFMLHQGEIRIGGFKTRGFGTVRLESPILRVKNYAGGQDLEPLEDVDAPVRLGDIFSVEDGQHVARGDRAWEALRRFAEVWDAVKLS